MKLRQSAFTEFAKMASEGVADLSDFCPRELNNIPSSPEKRSEFDWLHIHLHYIFTIHIGHTRLFFQRVLDELEQIKSEDQLMEFVKIEEIYAGVELIGYEHQWKRLNMIKDALRRY